MKYIVQVNIGENMVGMPGEEEIIKIVKIVKNTAAFSSILSSTISVLVAAFRRYQFSGERQ